MNPTIEALLILQARDVRVAELTDEQENIPRQVAAVERDLAAKTAQFGELKNKTRLIESERKKIDLEVKSKEAAIVRYKAQQLATRKNEEFAALIHEIEHTQAEISTLEDSELEFMEAYDKGLVEVAAGEKELAQAEAKTKDKKAALQKRAEVTAAELKTTLAQQAEAEKAVPEEVLTRYRRILQSKGDVALVPVDHGSCGGCHMKLTTQTVNNARREDALAACENCGRLVYAE
jgi:predicted  nucleic acid-binding Zn-ribbon protein